MWREVSSEIVGCKVNNVVVGRLERYKRKLSECALEGKIKRWGR